MKKIVFFNTLLLLCSCGMDISIKDVTSVTESDFEIQELQGENIELDSVWKPVRMYSNDSILFLVDNLGDYFVHAYNMNDNSFLSYNVPSGAGPNESMACWDLKIVGENIYASDPQRSVVRVYKNADFVSHSSVLPIRTVDFGMSPVRFSCTNNNQFALLDITDFETMITVCDSMGRKIDKCIPFPTGECGTDVANNSQLKFIFRNKIDYNSKLDKLVVFYDYFDLLDIYDGSFNLLSRVAGPYGLVPDVVEARGGCQITPDSKYAYETGCLSSNYIYLLFNGLTDKEDDESDTYFTKIITFDYSGHPHKIFNLDVPVFFITVNEQTRTIYGLADNPERCVVKFNY